MAATESFNKSLTQQALSVGLALVAIAAAVLLSLALARLLWAAMAGLAATWPGGTELIHLILSGAIFIAAFSVAVFFTKPDWRDFLLVPLCSLYLSAVVTSLLILYVGEQPYQAISVMIRGAVGSLYGWGFTLYYATNFIFTGLAVAVAIHARLF
ncbi:MAG: hypothetical protein AAF914_05165, partial [Pseudomonadota bacterium]